jgi:acyl carrier protein
MDRDSSVKDQLRRVFADVFGVDPTMLSDDASPHTILQWNSVGHLSLVLAIEGEFGVQFDTEEISGLISFGIIRERLMKSGVAEG